MKKNKEQKKGQESTIGKIIYGFLLFMPLIAIGVTCLYAIFNKNAYKSYSDVKIQKIESVENAETYQNTFTYNVKPKYTEHATSTKQYFDYISIENLNSNAVSFSIYSNETNSYLIMFWDSNNVEVQRFDWGNPNQQNSFEEFYFTKQSGLNLFNYANVYLIYETTQKIDNAFYYSVDKVTESPLFNWAENSIIYTTTANTCNALSITTPFIPLLMSYWLIISVIYFLYDIALMLVWLIHQKIHELQESL